MAAQSAMPQLTSNDCPPASPTPHSNLYISGFSRAYSPQRVRDLFLQFGPIFSVVMFRSKRAGCVQFERAEDAAQALAALDGRQLGPKTTLVVRYATKAYTPRQPPTSPTDTSSDGDSVGYSAGAASDVDAQEPPAWESDSETESPPDVFSAMAALSLPDEEGDDIDPSLLPPTLKAVAEANALLEQALSKSRSLAVQGTPFVFSHKASASFPWRD
eukprot:EG_transcript_15417